MGQFKAATLAIASIALVTGLLITHVGVARWLDHGMVTER
jgi:hypothetical protein